MRLDSGALGVWTYRTCACSTKRECAHSWNFLMRCEVPASGWPDGIDAWKLLLCSEETQRKEGVNVRSEEEENIMGDWNEMYAVKPPKSLKQN